jgi:formylglycine-generating enzyme required for sulfatase activity
LRGWWTWRESGITHRVKNTQLEGNVQDRDLQLEPDMVWVPAGEFLMGSDPQRDPQAREHETPQHRLFSPGFYMGRTPVTNAEYAVFVANTHHRCPSHWSGCTVPPEWLEHPVVHISWFDARAYCAWVAEATGRPYRLPSEAEWEKAASWDPAAPERKRRYPWGDRFDASRCNTKEAGTGETSPVGAHPDGASACGLLDMVGNVYEWTLTLWGRDMQKPAFKYPYDPADGREDMQAHIGVMRILRGGAFFYDASHARTAHRVKSYPDYAVRTRGFRLCAST